MYTITNDGRPLFDPSVSGKSLESPSMTLEANDIGTLSFTIYSNNPEFKKLKLFTSDLCVYNGSKLIARFRPITPKTNFNGGVSYMCEERIAQMDDIMRRPAKFSGTIDAFIRAVVNEYNSRVDASRAVTVGKIKYQPNVRDTFDSEDYEGCWETLQKNIVEQHGGYLLPRYTESAVYLDYLSEADLPAASQSIVFGVNMAEMSLEASGEDFYNVLIPVGPSEGSGDDRALMDITSVNGGKDYLENSKSVKTYGRREKTETWSGAENPSDLKSKAQTYFSENGAKMKNSLSLSAADLSMAGVNTAALMFMTMVTVRSEPHGVSAVYPLSKMVVPLGDPDLLRIDLGDKKEAFSDRVAKNSVSNRRSGGGGGRGASSGDMEHWEIITRKQEELLDGTGLTQMWESGIVVDAKSGVRLYSVADGLQHSYGELKVQNDQISSIVSKTGIDNLKKNQTLYTQITQTESSIISVAASVKENKNGIDDIKQTAVIQNSDKIAAVAGKFTIVGDDVRLQDGAQLQVYKDGVRSTVGTVKDIKTAKESITGTEFWQQRDSIALVAGKFTVSGDKLKLEEGTNFVITKDGVSSTVGTVKDINNTINERVTGTKFWQNKHEIGAVAGMFEVSGDTLKLKDGARLTVDKNGVRSTVGTVKDINKSIETITGTKFWQNRTSLNAIAGKFTVHGDTVRLVDGAKLTIDKDGVRSTVGTVKEINGVSSRVKTIEGSALWNTRDKVTGVVGKYQLINNGKDLRLIDGAGMFIKRDGLDFRLCDSGNVVSQINLNKEGVQIKASKVDLGDYATVQELHATNATIDNLTSGRTTASKLKADNIVTSHLNVGGNSCSWQQIQYVSSVTLNAPSLGLGNYHYFTTSSGTSYGGQLVLSWSRGSLTTSVGKMYFLCAPGD